MQELIELIENGETELYLIENHKQIWLEKEKQQIIDAYINGFPDDWESDKRIRYAKEYYNMNYNQNK